MSQSFLEKLLEKVAPPVVVDVVVVVGGTVSVTGWIVSVSAVAIHTITPFH